MLFRVLILAFAGWAALASAQVAGARIRKSPLPKGVVKAGPGVAARRQQLRQIERLSKMTPQEREQALAKLPPERRQDARRRLEAFQRLSPEERERLGRGLERFRDLPPEQQARVRRLFRQFNEVPAERRPALRRELNRLRQMDEEERRAHLNSDEFRGKHSVAEQQLLSELSEALPDDQD